MYLTTNRLIIRTMNQDDFDDVYEIYKDPRTCQFIPSGPWNDQNKHEFFHNKLSHQSLVDSGRIDLACVYESKVIAIIGIWYTEMRETVEIGYVLHYDYCGKGFATEALKSIIDYLFDELHIHRIQANIDPRNVSSYKLCERLGMRREAHFIKDYWFQGEWTDSYIYGMLEDDKTRQ